MIKLKDESCLQILFFFSIAILISALIIEYGFGFRACSLCKIERIPYGLAIIILTINYFSKKNQIFFIILLILLFSFSILISIYHFSIEQGFIEESALCVSKDLNLITKEDILNSLKEPRISCKNVAFKIFGLSLTTYNILISLLITICTAKIYLAYDKN